MYAFFLRTDGISVSISLRRPSSSSGDSSYRGGSDHDDVSRSEEASIRQQVPAGGLEGWRVYGLDPGRKNVFFASTSTSSDAWTVHCSSTHYRDLYGVKKRQDKVDMWLRNEGLEDYLKQMPSCKVMTTAELEKHIRYSFRRLRKVLNFYGTTRWRKLRQDSHYQKIRALNTLAKSIVGDRPDRVLVAYGAADFPSCAMGTPPVPVKGFRRYLQQRCKVIPVDEYYTSRVCSKCDGSLRRMTKRVWDANRQTWRNKSLWSVQVCQGCGMVWNRDRNASINILRIFKSVCATGERPAPFRRPRGRTIDDADGTGTAAGAQARSNADWAKSARPPSIARG
jgi:hypothetical protein